MSRPLLRAGFVLDGHRDIDRAHGASLSGGAARGLDRAKRLIAEVPRTDGRIWPDFLETKVALAEADFDRAGRLIESCAEDWTASEMIDKLVKALFKAGLFDRGAALALSTIGGTPRGRAIVEAVGALVAAGETRRAHRLVVRAQTLASAIDETRDHDWALRHVVDAATVAQQFDHATAIAGSIDSSFLRSKALATIISAMLKAGEWQRAEQLADTVAPDELPDRAVDFVADMPGGPAHRLTARILASKHWRTAIDAARPAAPEVLEAIIEELVAVTRTGTEPHRAFRVRRQGETTPD